MVCLYSTAKSTISLRFSLLTFRVGWINFNSPLHIRITAFSSLSSTSCEKSILLEMYVWKSRDRNLCRISLK